MCREKGLSFVYRGQDKISVFGSDEAHAEMGPFIESRKDDIISLVQEHCGPVRAAEAILIQARQDTQKPAERAGEQLGLFAP